MEQIVLKQKPIINHQLKEVGKDITARIEALNLEGQIVTTDSIKAVKSLRAELNKQFAVYNTQIKMVVDVASAPIVELKDAFKVEVTEKYKGADSLLKDKIGVFETELKEEKRDSLIAYFNELCASEEINFVKFEQLGLNINISTTEKKLKEQINTFIEKVVSELSLIDVQEYKVEIAAEYKATLNVSDSINKVVKRKEAEETELLRLEKVKHLARSKKLQSTGLKPDADTGTYVYNDNIYVVWDKVKNLEDSEFIGIVIQKELDIKESIEAEIKAEQKEEVINQPEPTERKDPKQFNAVSAELERPLIEEPDRHSKISSVIEKQNKEILKAPVVETKEDVVNAKFQVEGTYKQLKALGQYMKDNNVTYKNL